MSQDFLFCKKSIHLIQPQIISAYENHQNSFNNQPNSVFRNIVLTGEPYRQK